MSFKCLDGGSTIGKPSDRREALHGEMKGVTVLIAGSVKGTTGSRHNEYVNRCTQTRQHTHSVIRTQMRHRKTSHQKLFKSAPCATKV